MSLAVVKNAEGICPECGLILVNTDNQARVVTLKEYQQILQTLLLLLFILSLICIYWYFIL